MKMNIDDKIAYISGFAATTFITISWNDIVMTSLLGLIGGFFGIMGKQLFYFVKDIWKTKGKY